MSRNKSSRALAEYLSWLVATILMLIPFHAFLTTWAGSNFGNLDVFRIWKELTITAMVPFSLYFVWSAPPVRRWFLRAWLVRLIGGYILLYLALGVVAFLTSRSSASALLYSWLGSLRFLGFFILVSIISSQSDFLWRYWRQIVLLPAAAVVVFGLLQKAVLPYDFLRHFGYGSETIPAYQTVDNKLGYRRIQSTLRGANPLGAYLVVIMSLLLALINNKRAKWLVALFLGAVVALLFSYSRSSYLGAVVVVGLLVVWMVKNQRMRRLLIITGVTTVLLGTGAAALLRDNDIAQNTLFHTDNNSQSRESSNSGRTRALRDGLRDVIHEPFGRGPGTAGPQSFRNSQPPRIAENYFLQIGQEVGVFGMALFLAINIIVARLLWQQRQEPLAVALLASLVGLSLVNLVSHAWADDTLGLLWWGLAGIVVGRSFKDKKKVGAVKKLSYTFNHDRQTPPD